MGAAPATGRRKVNGKQGMEVQGTVQKAGRGVCVHTCIYLLALGTVARCRPAAGHGERGWGEKMVGPSAGEGGGGSPSQ